MATPRPLRLSCLLLPCLWLGAEEDAAPPADDRLHLRAGSWDLRLIPDEPLMPARLADPRQPRSALQHLSVLDSEIPHAGDSRVGIDIGGRFPLLRVAAPRAGTWQLDLEVGFFGQFDLINSLDGIGWDGWYSIELAQRPHPDWTWGLSFRHLSSHLMDEYVIERGAARLGYTREDVALQVAWQPHQRWAVYAAVTSALHMGCEMQDRFAAQAGGWYQGPLVIGGIAGFYAAADVQAFQERDWEPAVSVRAGVMVPGPITYRFALEAFSGRVPIGEFSAYDETWLGLVFVAEH